jgi:hypothetical protein
VRVEPGELMTLSAFLCANRPGTVAHLAVNEEPERLRLQEVTVGTE